MAKVKIHSYVVVGCTNEIVAMESYVGAASLARKLNNGRYINKPYRVVYVDGDLEEIKR